MEGATHLSANNVIKGHVTYYKSDTSQTYPTFSHLQQQNIHTRTPMMRSAPATDNVMIKTWKFTEYHKKQKVSKNDLSR